MLEVEEGVLSVKQNLSNLDQSVIHYKPGPGTLHAQDFVAYIYLCSSSRTVILLGLMGRIAAYSDYR